MALNVSPAGVVTPMEQAWVMLKALPEQQMYASGEGVHAGNLGDITQARASHLQPGYPRMSPNRRHSIGALPEQGADHAMWRRLEAEQYSPYDETGYPYEDEFAAAGTVHPAILGLLQRLEREQMGAHSGPRDESAQLDIDRGPMDIPPSSTYHRYNNPLFEEAADMARRRESTVAQKNWEKQRLLADLAEQYPNLQSGSPLRDIPEGGQNQVDL
jgi:hypothetical protein